MIAGGEPVGADVVPMVDLSVEEIDQLAQYEATITKGLATFIEVGAALASIRDERLYRRDYATFDDYCRARWGWDRRRAYQLMDADEAAENVNHGSHPARPMSGRRGRWRPCRRSSSGPRGIRRTRHYRRASA